MNFNEPMKPQDFKNFEPTLRPAEDFTVAWDQRTQSVFDLVSLAEFELALDEAMDAGRPSLIETIRYRRAKRNPRVMEKLYSRVLEECPVAIYAGPAGFDWKMLLDWLIEKLPVILSLLLLFL